jgi:DNA-directed RNA polymerase specialized sigma subunit
MAESNLEKPWLDRNGRVYSDDALREITKNWSAETWELFLFETVDREQAETLQSPFKYDETCDKTWEQIWNVDTTSAFPIVYQKAAPLALKRLTTQQSRILRHLFWDAMSIRKTAETMGVSRSLVSIQKSNSIKKLKRLVEIEIAKFPISERQEGFLKVQKGESRDEQIRQVYKIDLKGVYA